MKITGAEATRQAAVAYYVGIGIVVVAALACMTLLQSRVNHDNAYLLEIGRRVVAGGVPYVDFVDTNPPLVFYMSALPALMEQTLGISIITAFRLCVALLTLSSALLIRVLLLRNLSETRLAETVFWFFLAGAILFGIEYSFGQRGHLFVVMYLPFLLVRWSRSNDVALPAWLTIPTGVVAGVGACIKPHYLVTVGLVEVFRFARHPSRRRLLLPEMMAFLGAGLLYGIHLLTLPKPMAEALFNRWMPLILEHYAVYSRPLIRGLTIDSCCYATLAVFALLFLRSPKTARLDELARTIAVFTLASLLVVYLGQQMFWDYHLIPAQVGAFSLFAIVVAQVVSAHAFAEEPRPGLDPQVFLLLAFLGVLTVAKSSSFELAACLTVGFTGLLCLTRRRLRGRLPGLASRALIVFGLAVVASYTLKAQRMFQDDHPASLPVGQRILELSDEGDSVLILVTSVRPAFPDLLMLNRKPAGRYLNAFPIAFYNNSLRAQPDGKFEYLSREDLQDGERLFLSEMGEDIERHRPSLIMVQDIGESLGCPKGFRISKYLEHAGFYEREMAGYTQVGEVVGRFLFYVRSHSSSDSRSMQAATGN